MSQFSFQDRVNAYERSDRPYFKWLLILLLILIAGVILFFGYHFISALAAEKPSIIPDQEQYVLYEDSVVTIQLDLDRIDTSTLSWEPDIVEDLGNGRYEIQYYRLPPDYQANNSFPLVVEGIGFADRRFFKGLAGNNRRQQEEITLEVRLEEPEMVDPPIPGPVDPPQPVDPGPNGPDPLPVCTYAIRNSVGRSVTVGTTVNFSAQLSGNGSNCNAVDAQNFSWEAGGIVGNGPTFNYLTTVQGKVSVVLRDLSGNRLANYTLQVTDPKSNQQDCNYVMAAGPPTGRLEIGKKFTFQVDEQNTGACNALDLSAYSWRSSDGSQGTGPVFEYSAREAGRKTIRLYDANRQEIGRAEFVVYFSEAYVQQKLNGYYQMNTGNPTAQETLSYQNQLSAMADNESVKVYITGASSPSMPYSLYIKSIYSAQRTGFRDRIVAVETDKTTGKIKVLRVERTKI